jgi:hypothetical protein
MNASATAILSNPQPCGHIVYPYTEDSQVAEAVCLFASAGLRKAVELPARGVEGALLIFPGVMDQRPAVLVDYIADELFDGYLSHGPDRLEKIAELIDKPVHRSGKLLLLVRSQRAPGVHMLRFSGQQQIRRHRLECPGVVVDKLEERQKNDRGSEHYVTYLTLFNRH